MSHEAFEFDVTVTVRRRVWLSGPKDRETARDLLTQVIPSMGFGPFIKRAADGHPIETVLSNGITVEDPAP